MSADIPTPENPVMSTMRADGSRRWMFPRVSKGVHWKRRRLLAYVLIAIFTVIPYITVGGKPLFLLDLPTRHFTIFGMTFLPTDTVLLALFLVSVIVGIVLATALLGRVWCGWMCPQTVYLEFVYRPLERLFDGPPRTRHRPGKKNRPWRTALKYLTFAIVSAYLAHTFLAYFVGVKNLAVWVRHSPIEHPAAFLLMLGTTALMMFDFSYFREQMCLVACPYGRFQSVMLDRDSLIVGYDRRRGEPRTKGRDRKNPDAGDCIDCGWCTDTCPTGIDIRNGLQMECIHCTQCIDACDAVMDKIGKPRGLIRFSSQAKMNGQTARVIRPRVVIYPVVLLAFVVAFGLTLLGKQTADITLLRGLGRPFYEIAPGEIANPIRVKITNRSGATAAYHLELVGNSPAQLVMNQPTISLDDGESHVEPVLIQVPATAFTNGKLDVQLRIADGKTLDRTLSYRLLGPYVVARQSTTTTEASRDG